MRRHVVVVCVGSMFFFAGCSYYWSEGGEMNEKKQEHLESLLDNTGNTEFDNSWNQGFDPDLVSTDPVVDPTDPKDDSPNTGNSILNALEDIGYGPTDEQVCSVIKASSLIRTYAKEAINYLCDRQGLKSIRSRNYTDTEGTTPYVDIIANENKNSTSYFITLNATYDNGTVQGLSRLSEKYCTSFEAYKQVYGTAGLVDIQNLIINNSKSTLSDIPGYPYEANTGCNFKFIAKPIYLGFVQPQYIGQLRTYMNSSGTAFFETSKLIKSVKQVNDIIMFTIGVTDQNGFLQTYNYKSTNAPNLGWDVVHDTLLKKGKETVVEGTKHKVKAVKALSN